METVAIVGTGVAGLGCAWNLRHSARIVLFEQDHRPGGHTNTVEVSEGHKRLPIDTGFIVFNHVTYPHLCGLFEELKIPTKPAEMSFSVQHLPSRLEYNGMGVNKVFAQRLNFFRPRFHRLLGQIQRFFQVGRQLLQSGEAGGDLTMKQFVERHGLGQDFLDLYLVPMSSAVWSTDSRDVLGFPASTLLHFFHNHGFLGTDTHHHWYTVDGGAKTYVDKILTAVGSPRVSDKVVRVEEDAGHVSLTTASGVRLNFDRVILACHADQSLAVLSSPDQDQQRLLSPFRYQKNLATLHTDERVMPERRLAWASWNYRVDESHATTHYWMNALQGISDETNYFVSLNDSAAIAPEKVLYETTYEHPIFTIDAISAQKELPALNRRSRQQRLYFCGSYFRYGFHEDAYQSAVHLCSVLNENLGAK